MLKSYVRSESLPAEIVGSRSNMSEVYCICADWEPEIAKVNGPIVLQSLRAGRDLYTGKPFRFCPWCGLSLTAKDCDRFDPFTITVSEKP